jgi:holliday junction DNA helicase RuvB
VAGKKRGDRPGGGLKARRLKYVERLLLSAAEKVIWDRAIRKLMKEMGAGSTPSKAAIHLAQMGLSSDPEGNLPGRTRHDRALATIVLHIGQDGKRWIDGEDGPEGIDRETFEELSRAGARTVEVKDVLGSGECPAIQFGERGAAAPGDRDRQVSAEVKELVLLRDGACVICQRTEDLTPHHLDSHAHGGASEFTRLVALCEFCQGSVHAGDLVIGLDDDGKVHVRDREGTEVTRSRSEAEVLAQAEQDVPLTMIDVRGAPPSEAKTAGTGEELLSLDALPAEITAAQWLALESSIEWSASQRVFLFRSGGEHICDKSPGASLEAPWRVVPAPASSAHRPGSFDEFVGQRRVIENLSLSARAAKARGTPLGHLILCGQPGLGKTTVARLLAREFGSVILETVGGNIADPGQLVSLLARLEKDAFFLIDEIHALGKELEEFLSSAMDDGAVGVVLRQGARTRIVRVRLSPFTLMGTTTVLGDLSEPFRSRFQLIERLDAYSEESLAEVTSRAAMRMGTVVDLVAAREIARRARGTPRAALRILERARDVSQVVGATSIESAHVVRAAESLGIDLHGLDDVDRKALRLLLALGRPMGEEALSARLGVDRRTFHEVHEPFLERRGLIERTERGRMATEEARRLYGVRRPGGVPCHHDVEVDIIGGA